MKKYAIAVHNGFEGDNKIHIVEAETPVDAIIIALEGKLDNGLELPETVEELKVYYIDGELIISDPVEI